MNDSRLDDKLVKGMLHRLLVTVCPFVVMNEPPADTADQIVAIRNETVDRQAAEEDHPGRRARHCENVAALR